MHNNSSENRTTLLILAAGMGSRFGGIKQLTSVGNHNQCIIDYSIYDAIRSGFSKVVFVVRDEILDVIKSIYDEKLKSKIEVDYVVQRLDEPAVLFREKPSGRLKPWGTGHALLCAELKVDSPFCMINADDFYGLSTFRLMHQFLITSTDETTYAMVAYRLDNTLSENGAVSRGLITVNESGNLQRIEEASRLISVDGQILSESDNRIIAANKLVSMNMWAFKPGIFALLKDNFREFLSQNRHNNSAEFFIPLAVKQMISQGHCTVKVFETGSKWFGITYKEDLETVRHSIRQLTLAGCYPDKLWTQQS